MPNVTLAKKKFPENGENNGFSTNVQEDILHLKHTFTIVFMVNLIHRYNSGTIMK